MKKLDNVKRDHEKRLNELQTEQLADEKKAHIIQINLDIVSDTANFFSCTMSLSN